MLINRYPKFWNSIRPHTLAVQSKAKQIDSSIARLQLLYPSLRPAHIYFTIGGLRSGGTTTNDMVLIGAEIATGTADTDVSEFPDKWLEGVFKSQDPDNIVPLNIHEYVHTQQKGSSKNLLGQSIREGACDFITELVIGKPMSNNYIVYGREHEPELKEQFRKEMFTAFYSNWLYNGASAKTVADLGYFMGYAICKAYYDRASDKKKAIRQIIELDYSNENEVEKFLKRSGYYTERIDQKALIREFEALRPSVVRLEPFNNDDMEVDPSIKEMKNYFFRADEQKKYFH